jgi:hypothetical protein
MRAGIVAILLLSVIFFECKNSHPDFKTILLRHSWKPEKFMQNGQQMDLQPCQKDNFLVFANDSTGWEDNGTIKCDSSDSIKQPFQYVLSLEDSTIYMDNFEHPGCDYIWHINQLNDTVLSISFKASSSTREYKFDWTFRQL